MTLIDTHYLHSRDNETKETKQEPVFSPAKFGASLFGEKNQATVDCLIYFILKRDVQSISNLLNGDTPSHLQKISAGEKRKLDEYGSAISDTPIFLALQLQNDSVIDSMTPDATPADVVAALNQNRNALQIYSQSVGLSHPTEKATQAFADKLNNAVASVSRLTMEKSTPTA